MPESYVIFITETDVLGEGLPLYEIQRTIKGSHRHFDDGSHIVYVNSAVVDTNTPLGRLMHDFRCAHPEKMYYEVLAERAGAFKNTEEGVIEMSSKWEQFVKEVSAEAMERGREKERLSSIRTLMTTTQLTAEKVMDMLAIPKTKQGHYKAML